MGPVIGEAEFVSKLRELVQTRVRGLTRTQTLAIVQQHLRELENAGPAAAARSTRRGTPASARASTSA
jgi:hypothetical protein